MTKYLGIPCPHTVCSENAACPISLGPCPGVCLYGIILHNMQLGIIVLDAIHQRVEFHNQAAADILNPVVPIKDFDALRSFLTHPREEPSYTLMPDNTSQVIEISDRLIGYSTYPIQNGDYLWIFISDITEKKRYESIAASVNTLENIGFVFSGIRHEIGNPINSIKMTLSALKAQLRSFSMDDIEEYLNRSLDELARVEVLLRSLKNINMFEKPATKRVDLLLFLDHFFKLIHNDFSRRNISLRKAISPGTYLVLVDERPLQQVLLNLFTNAADALEGRDSPCIKTTVYKKNGLVWIKVSDNGLGIPEQNISQVFNPFFTTKAKGTGLGLLLSRKMLASMNCTIEIESSEENRGTTFIISIPEAGDAAC